MNEEELEDYDDSHAQIFYSFPFKEEEEFIYQYKATIVKDTFSLDIIKTNQNSIDEIREDNELEYEVLFNEEDEIIIENIIILPIADAIGKMRKKIDLRIKDLQTTFTKEDKLSQLYDDILYN